MTTTHQIIHDENDGWLLALMSFGCSEFGWSMDYVLDGVSVMSLLLLMRQKMYNNGLTMMKLIDKEHIDALDWDNMVQENHRMLMEQMTKARKKTK